MKGTAWLAGFLVLLAAADTGAVASDLDVFKVKREQVFEFAEKPNVTRNGDRVEITFEAKGLCDATVAIEDGNGKIIRHLASGVLGPNAPGPFQKNAKRQTVVWDGKNEEGEYVDNREMVTVRVSLGLQPRLERTLLWSPHRRWFSDGTMICPTREGVYVYDHNVKLFDHDGNYVRTIYPFPSDRLEQVGGLSWRTFPQDGRRLPLKGTIWANTFLNFGNFDFGQGEPRTGRGYGTLAARGGRVYLANARLNRLADFGGRPLAGPQTSVTEVRGNATRTIGPWSSAVSPDGRYLYLSGYLWYADWYYSDWGGLHGVMRMDLTKDEPAQPFLGEMFKPGSDDEHFTNAAGLACDAQGRIYVADHVNDRVQIFSPDGKLLKTLATSKPAQVCVHPSSGDIYVFSWILGTKEMKDYARKWREKNNRWLAVPPRVTRYGPFDKPDPAGSWPLPLRCHYGVGESAGGEPQYWRIGSEWRAMLDGWADPPTIWLVPGHVHVGHYCEEITYEQGSIKVLAFDGRKLAVKRDFAADAVRPLVRVKPPKDDRQRLYVNPADGVLYVGEHNRPSIYPTKSFSELVKVDFSGAAPRVALIQLPFDAEDMGFDLDGNPYLRNEDTVVRYDSGTWREIPYDYGERRNEVTFTEKTTRAISGAILPSCKPGCWHMGGMAVSPRGHVAITCCNPEKPADKRVGDSVIKQSYVSKYTPQLYPGRAVGWEIHILDKHGKVVCQDAVPGVGFCHGIGLDRDDNLYLLHTGARVLDGKPYFVGEGSCTLIKVSAGKAKFLSPSNTPIPLSESLRPKRPLDFVGRGTAGWVEGAEWFYPGAGFRGAHDCSCLNCRPTLDLFARSFVPEIEHCSVAMLDTNGNLILRIGRYGNADDGRPLVLDGGPGNPKSLGGDEVSLFHACYLGTHTDRRLFIADIGNERLLSVKLDYHATERVALKGVPDGGH